MIVYVHINPNASMFSCIAPCSLRTLINQTALIAKMQSKGISASVRIPPIQKSLVLPQWKQNQEWACWSTNSFPVGPLWRRSNNFRVIRNSLLRTFNCGTWVPVNLKVPGPDLLLKQLLTIEPSLLPQHSVMRLRKEQQQQKRMMAICLLSEEVYFMTDSQE